VDQVYDEPLIEGQSFTGNPWPLGIFVAILAVVGVLIWRSNKSHHHNDPSEPAKHSDVESEHKGHPKKK